MYSQNGEGLLLSGIIIKGSPIPYENKRVYQTIYDFQERSRN